MAFNIGFQNKKYSEPLMVSLKVFKILFKMLRAYLDLQYS